MVPAHRRRVVRGGRHRPDDRTIEIQYFDGTIEEIDLDDWLEDEIEATEPPEDWTGSVDVEPEDTENEYEAEPDAAASSGAIRCSSSIAARSSGYSEVELSGPQGRRRPLLSRGQRPRSAGSSSGTPSSSIT